ncbi:hypothetical protein [Nocardioides mesophilus]|uniref:Uncharacterized protein n=1 Tax=Nocardioides mesophilus TaxID=433659 RepID=A0A7G9RB47_9ACTN|nr:hypothetical protein [Nocardioides mesophilus]QNN52822.1 hypothetical protein H9L09_20750 [Nocardioides mesophilus]
MTAADPSPSDRWPEVVPPGDDGMTSDPEDRVYELRVSGLVPPELLSERPAGTEVVGHEVRTVVSGRFEDQAALHGFLNRLRAFGLELLEIRRVAAADEDDEDDEDPDRP